MPMPRFHDYHGPFRGCQGSSTRARDYFDFGGSQRTRRRSAAQPPRALGTAEVEVVTGPGREILDTHGTVRGSHGIGAWGWDHRRTLADVSDRRPFAPVRSGGPRRGRTGPHARRGASTVRRREPGRCDLRRAWTTQPDPRKTRSTDPSPSPAPRSPKSAKPRRGVRSPRSRDPCDAPCGAVNRRAHLDALQRKEREPGRDLCVPERDDARS